MASSGGNKQEEQTFSPKYKCNANSHWHTEN